MAPKPQEVKQSPVNGKDHAMIAPVVRAETRRLLVAKVHTYRTTEEPLVLNLRPEHRARYEEVRAERLRQCADAGKHP